MTEKTDYHTVGSPGSGPESGGPESGGSGVRRSGGSVGLGVRAGGLEVGAQRAPRHLVHYKSGAYIFMIIKIFPFVNSSVLSFPLTIL